LAGVKRSVNLTLCCGRELSPSESLPRDRRKKVWNGATPEPPSASATSNPASCTGFRGEKYRRLDWLLNRAIPDVGDRDLNGRGDAIRRPVERRADVARGDATRVPRSTCATPAHCRKSSSSAHAKTGKRKAESNAFMDR
jgi:hypothetical protein